MAHTSTSEVATEVGDEWEKRQFIEGERKVPVDVYSSTKRSEEGRFLESPKRCSSKSSVHSEESTRRCGRLRNICGTHAGMVVALLSCVGQALSSIGVKMLAGKISALEVAVCRLFSYFMVTSVLLVFFGITPRISRTQALWLLIRVSIGTTAMCLSFYSYQNIPVGDATAIFFTSPIFTGIFAWLLLSEKFTVVDAVFAVVAIAGIMLIAKPSFIFGDLAGPSSGDGNAMLGITCAIIGAICASLVYVSVRKLGGINVHPLLQIWMFGLFGMVLTAILTTILGLWTIPQCGKDRIILIIVSLIGAISQLFLTYAFKLEKATYVALIKTNTVIIAFILEYLFFKTIPFWLSIIGAVLVVSSSIGITIKRWMASRQIEEDDEAQELDEYKSDCDSGEKNCNTPSLRSRGKTKMNELNE